MPTKQVFTNQRGVLRWRLAITGVTRADLDRSPRHDPIVLHGTMIDVTVDRDEPIVHFCRSQWHVEGIKQNLLNEVFPESIIEFSCPIPEAGNRYNVQAELSWDASKEMVVLTVTNFFLVGVTPENTAIVVNDLNPADRFVSHAEEPIDPRILADLTEDDLFLAIA